MTLLSRDENRESERRKKLTNSLNIILKYVHIAYAEGLNCLSEEALKQISQEKCLLKLQEFAETRNKYFKDMEMGENYENFTNLATN